jgi:nucleolar protein 56
MEYLVSTWFGTFVYDLSGVRESRLEKKDPKSIAQRLKAMKAGEVLEDEKALAAGKKLAASDARLKQIGEYRPDDVIFTRLVPRPEQFGYDLALLHSAAIQLAVEETRNVIGTRDKHVMQAISALEEMQRSANLLSERLFEWYGMHFPEFAEKTQFEVMAREVALYGDRETMAKHLEWAKPLAEISAGGDINETEKRAYISMAKPLDGLYVGIREIQAYIEKAMGEIAPNVSKIAGPTLGARIITLAGGLERLANSPAGTVQLLGAEAALFRHLRQGSRPPKHGILFQHPVINKAKREERGKLARAYAGKIAIAAKADAYSKEYIADVLLVKLDARVRQIMQ